MEGQERQIPFHLLMVTLQAKCDVPAVFHPFIPVVEMACQSKRGGLN